MPHKCPEAFKKQNKYCDTCKSNTKLCVSPQLHQPVKLPDSFAGAALGMAMPVPTLNASTWSSEPTVEMSAIKGGLGQTTPLTTWVILVRGEDSIKVLALVDSGSESSYFHPALQQFAIETRKQI